MSTIFLTKEEQPLFAKIAASLTEGWTLETEDQTAYETPEVLEMRGNISPLRRHPAVKEIAEKVQIGEKIENLKMPELSDEDVAEFFFMIGAKGMTIFLEMLLKEAKTDDDLRLIGHISDLRHSLLETNASVSLV